MEPREILLKAVAELRRRHLNQARIAEYFDVSEGLVSAWLKGIRRGPGDELQHPEPSFAVVVKALEVIGGDFTRALPGYVPESDSGPLAAMKAENALLRKSLASALKHSQAIQEVAQKALDSDTHHAASTISKKPARSANRKRRS